MKNRYMAIAVDQKTLKNLPLLSEDEEQTGEQHSREVN
jgi:hypothetical protein